MSAHKKDCAGVARGEWSADLCPRDPDNYWICADCGARIKAEVITVVATVHDSVTLPIAPPDPQPGISDRELYGMHEQPDHEPRY